MWALELSDYFQETQEKYESQLEKAIFLSSLSKRNPRRSVEEAVERACDKQDAFREFLRKLKRFGDKHADTNTLPVALDENGREIFGFYCLQDGSWAAYLYRDATPGHQRSLALLLFSERDRSQNVKDALAVAIDAL